jgi:ADP-ribose pyrophosphatase YjhB (NUDIX family)
MNNNFTIRLTGILIEQGNILLVKQKVSETRNWSLPGGKLEPGESINDGIVREFFEETGLQVKVKRLLYLSELPEVSPSVVHISFLLERVSGEIIMPTNEFETTPIYDVKFVPVKEIEKYGFSMKFKDIILNNFPNSGDYIGHKRMIGL